MAEVLVADPPKLQKAQRKLALLQLAESTGNISKACRQLGVGRKSFYRWKHRYEERDLEGLIDLPRVHKNHPMTKSPDDVALVVALSLEHPAWGCARVSVELMKTGVCMSGPVVQQYLNAHGIGRLEQRARLMEERAIAGQIVLTAEQTQCVARINPCFLERHLKPGAPGQLLCQDNLRLGCINGLGKLYLEAAVDTYSSYAFGYLSQDEIKIRKPSENRTPRNMNPEVQLIRYYVVPKFALWNIPIQSILTNHYGDNNTKYSPYRSYLTRHSIKPSPYNSADYRMNGFIRNFANAVRHEFVNKVLQQSSFTSLKSFRMLFNEWLAGYNDKRGHLGYPNNGASPNDIVQHYLTHC